MKAPRNVVVTIAAFALVGTLAGMANAQQAIVENAHFILPFRAVWADTVLRPGDYSLSVTQLASGRGVQYSVTFSGADNRKTILAVRPLGPHVGKSSMLVAVRGGEVYCIRTLHLPDAHLVLTFPAPKAERACCSSS